MTRRHKITAVAAGGAVIVVVGGVVIVGWPLVRERWYATQLEDPTLDMASRVHAAARLRDMQSPLLMERSLDLLETATCAPQPYMHSQARPVPAELSVVLAILGPVLGERPWGQAGGFCIPSLGRAVCHTHRNPSAKVGESK